MLNKIKIIIKREELFSLLSFLYYFNWDPLLVYKNHNIVQ